MPKVPGPRLRFLAEPDLGPPQCLDRVPQRLRLRRLLKSVDPVRNRLDAAHPEQLAIDFGRIHSCRLGKHYPPRTLNTVVRKLQNIHIINTAFLIN